jgi:hypothetical protein
VATLEESRAALVRAVPNHRHATGASEKLADAYLDVGRPADALPILEGELLPVRRQRGDALTLATTLAQLGRAFADCGRPAEAIAPLRESLAIRRRTLPARAWQTANTESLLGGCLAALGQDAEAGLLLADGVRGLEAAADLPQPRRQDEARARLAAFRGGRPAN